MYRKQPVGTGQKPVGSRDENLAMAETDRASGVVSVGRKNATACKAIGNQRVAVKYQLPLLRWDETRSCRVVFYKKQATVRN